LGWAGASDGQAKLDRQNAASNTKAPGNRRWFEVVRVIRNLSLICQWSLPDQACPGAIFKIANVGGYPESFPDNLGALKPDAPARNRLSPLVGAYSSLARRASMLICGRKLSG
jgi:hypothetical protein